MNFQSILSGMLSSIMQEPLLFGLAVLLLLLAIQNMFLGRRLSRLTRGAQGSSLEEAIHKLYERVDVLEKYARSSTQKIKTMDARIGTSVRGVALERFDPFQNSGGQQSFVTAFLNEQGDGVVVSGIHSRDGVRVYAKPVLNFTSERELSDEEKKAVKNAQKNLT